MPKPTYILPAAASSPRRNWSITRILIAAGPEEMAVALGKWDGKDVIGLRWNGTAENPIGNPQSRGLATWFIVESGVFTDAIIEALPAEAKQLARQFIPAS